MLLMGLAYYLAMCCCMSEGIYQQMLRLFRICSLLEPVHLPDELGGQVVESYWKGAEVVMR